MGTEEGKFIPYEVTVIDKDTLRKGYFIIQATSQEEADENAKVSAAKYSEYYKGNFTIISILQLA